MKDRIIAFIEDYAEEKDKNGMIKNIWRKPVIAFGDAENKDFNRLKELVTPDHQLPGDVLPGAKTIISFFVPFKREIAESNIKNRLSSRTWAMAYEKTNAFILDLDIALCAFLMNNGYRSAYSEEGMKYDESILKSKWSQRHIAYFSGLGTFGMNNMLITSSGSCGRFGSVLTDFDTEHTYPVKEEYCKYKRDKSCISCIKRCPMGALSETGFDRFLCNTLCDENSKVHTDCGERPSYVLETGEEVWSSNTCGKCAVGIPCAFKIPK